MITQQEFEQSLREVLASIGTFCDDLAKGWMPESSEAEEMYDKADTLREALEIGPHYFCFLVSGLEDDLLPFAKEFGLAVCQQLDITLKVVQQWIDAITPFIPT